jgi:hypothetical protein
VITSSCAANEKGRTVIDRIFALRIVRWQFKLSYVLVAYLLAIALVQLVGLTGAAPGALEAVGNLLYLLAFLYGARIFRGSDEALAAPRPWWKMTSKSTLSQRLGILFAFLTTLYIADIALGLSPDPRLNKAFGGPEQLGIVIQSVFLYGVLAFLYINSGMRLRRLERR